MKGIIAVLVMLVGCLSCRSQRPLPPMPVFPLGKTWSIPAEDPFDERSAIQSLTGSGDLILLSLRGGALHALDCSNGARLWTRRNLPGPVSIANGLIVVAKRNGALRGLEPSTGRELWKTQTGVSDPLAPWIASDRIVVAGFGLASLVAETGVIQWTRGEGRFTTPPRVIGTRIIAGDSAGIVHAFDVSTGRELWTRRTNSTLLCPAIGDRDERLYLGTSNGWFLALRAKNGGSAWRWRVGADTIYEAVIYEDLVCFAGNDAVLYALKRRNGHLIWRAPLPSRPLGPPLIAHATLLVPCYSEHEGRSIIVGVDVTKGRRLGVFETPAELAFPPLPCGERFVLGFRDQTILTVAHKSPTPTPTPASPVPRLKPLAMTSPTATPSPTPASKSSLSTQQLIRTLTRS